MESLFRPPFREFSTVRLLSGGPEMLVVTCDLHQEDGTWLVFCTWQDPDTHATKEGTFRAEQLVAVR
jgi:uncharacterized protein YodC (DUF2158 family)